MHTHIGNPYKILEDKLMITWFIIGVWTCKLCHKMNWTLVFQKKIKKCVYIYTWLKLARSLDKQSKHNLKKKVIQLLVDRVCIIRECE